MPHAQTGFRRLRQRQDHPALFPHQARPNSRRSILLVPEQFTSSTEGRIYRELGDALSGMVESFSFTSLAERILSAEGGAAVQTLSDAGRAVLVRRALEELQDHVHYYYRHRRSAAFCQMAAQNHRRAEKCRPFRRTAGRACAGLRAGKRQAERAGTDFQGYETLLAGTGMDPPTGWSWRLTGWKPLLPGRAAGLSAGAGGVH